MNAAQSPNLSGPLALLSMALLPSFAHAEPQAGKVALDFQRRFLPEQLQARDSTTEQPRLSRHEPSLVGNSCASSAFALCYDQEQRRAVYRPARAFMPTIEGLTAESVSLRRGSVILKYSFR